MPVYPGAPGRSIAEHADYQKTYWRTHPEAARVALLVKNNGALDLKHSAAEVWLVGRMQPIFVKNNVAFSEVTVFQRVIPLLPKSCKEHRSGSGDTLRV
jgi:hypothetical protein